MTVMISRGYFHWRDGLRLLALASISLGIGLIINALRPQPLPLSYESPEQRLHRIVAQMGTGKSTQVLAVPEISLQALRTAIDQGKALLIDARAPLFYEHSHLPRAFSLSRLQFAEDYPRLKDRLAMNRDLLLIVYCAGDDCRDSELVAAALVRLGHQPVNLFRGGYAAWKNAGLPLENGQ